MKTLKLSQQTGSPAAADAAFPFCFEAWKGKKDENLKLLPVRRARLEGLAGVLQKGLHLAGGHQQQQQHQHQMMLAVTV